VRARAVGVPFQSMGRHVLGLAVLLAPGALAEVYTWTDPDGTVHYTDNPASVPGTIKAKTTTGVAISMVSGAPRDAGASSPPTVAVPSGPASPTAQSEQRRIEYEWRAAFRDVAERQARLEDEIEVDRRKVEDVDGLPVAARYQCFNGGFAPFFGPGPTVMVTPGAVGSASQVTTGSSFGVGVGQGVGGVSVGVGGGVVVTQNRFFNATGTGVMAQPCVFAFNPEFERAKERLELNRKALARVKAEAADLERRASFEGVPREWRR
jgi:hypothetical protein